jgi:hypothetical protein
VFGFNADFSLTAGSNDYASGATLNVSLSYSPLEFNVEGYTI